MMKKVLRTLAVLEVLAVAVEMVVIFHQVNGMEKAIEQIQSQTEIQTDTVYLLKPDF